MVSSLKIVNRNFVNVNQDVISLAVNNLEELLLIDSPKSQNLRTEQLISIFSAMCKETKLKTLNLENIDISKVEPLTLAAALTKVEKVIIWKESKHPR